jgi:thiamine-phosphate pyrophosphorylase
MKTIVISPDYSLPNEIETVHAMLSAGLDYFHVRKPAFSLAALRDYLAEFDAAARDRLVLHVPFATLRQAQRDVKSQRNMKNNSRNESFMQSSACTELIEVSKQVGGFHERDTDFTIEADKRRSRSVHLPFDSAQGTNVRTTPERSRRLSVYNYILLSPIFPSISKANYGKEPNLGELRKNIQQIPTDVYALGGINPSRVAVCQSLGFAGIAMHGHIWQVKSKTEQFERFMEMKELCAPVLSH